MDNTRQLQGRRRRRRVEYDDRSDYEAGNVTRTGWIALVTVIVTLMVVLGVLAIWGYVRTWEQDGDIPILQQQVAALQTETAANMMAISDTDTLLAEFIFNQTQGVVVLQTGTVTLRDVTTTDSLQTTYEIVQINVRQNHPLTFVSIAPDPATTLNIGAASASLIFDGFTPSLGLTNAFVGFGLLGSALPVVTDGKLMITPVTTRVVSYTYSQITEALTMALNVPLQIGDTVDFVDTVNFFLALF